MQADDAAAKNLPPFSDTYGAETSAYLPEQEMETFAPNAFAPISAAERLREKPRSDKSRRGGAFAPPMRPGQRYGTSYEERPTDRGSVYEETRSYDSPYQQPGEASRGFAEAGERGGIENYRQAYWEHLKNAAGSAAAAENQEEPEVVPAYLRGHMTGQPVSPQPYSGGAYCPEEAGSYGQDEVQRQWQEADDRAWDFFQGGAEAAEEALWEGKPAPWQEADDQSWNFFKDGAEAAEEAFPEDSPEKWRGEALWEQEAYQSPAYFPGNAEAPVNEWQQPAPADVHPPKETGEKAKPKQKKSPAPAKSEEKPPLRVRFQREVQQAFAAERADGMTKISLGKIVAVSAITLMLVFCVVEIGKIAVSMMQNEQEMKALRAEYASRDEDLLQNAYRMELPPPGVTFAPAATPAAPAENAVQTAALPVAETAQDIQSAEAIAAQNQRSKTTKYQDNPLGNIREDFAEMRRDTPDVIGHLAIDGLVNETVVQRNNTFYLTHNARGSVDSAGAVFMDEACNIKQPPENLLLRGQGAVKSKLFASLFYYESGGVEFLRQYGIIRMDTLYEDGLYVVFAVVNAASNPQSPQYFNYAGYPAFQSDWQMGNYVAQAKQLSLYEIPLDVQPADRLLTLAAIGDGVEKESLVILARKLRPGETAQSLAGILGAARLNGNQ